MQPNGEVISLKAWRHRFWRDRLLLVWEKRDAFWSDLWRSDDIISMVYLLFIAEAVLRIGFTSWSHGDGGREIFVTVKSLEISPNL
eukprot:scaffold28035_cov211-Skeletonema_marinoi.AAC.3